MKVALVLFTFCVVWFKEFREVSCQSTEGPGVSCTDDSGCTTYSGTYCGGYSQCLKCVCQTGYVYDSTTKSCLTKVNIGDACSINDQCPDKQGASAGGLCSTTCACDSGYIANSNKTDCRKSYHGEACSAASDCIDTTTMTCTDSLCACKGTTLTIASDKKSCRQAYIGETCSAANECLSSISSVSCDGTTKQCTCPTSSPRVATDNKSCLKQIIGGTCSQATDCLDSTTMTCSTTCKCSTDYVQVSETTCRLPLYGEVCNTVGKCDNTTDPNLSGDCASTAGSTCACSTNYKQSTTGQLCQKTAIDSACSKIDECGTNTQCSTNCLCIDNYVKESDGINCRKPYYDETCTANTADFCSGTYVNTTCPSGGKCECEDNRIANGTTGNCRLAILNEPCSSTGDCDTSITSVTCAVSSGSTNKVCSCPPSLNEVSGNCEKVAYGQSCAGSKTCVDGYTCSSDSCDCSAGNVYDSAISGCRNTNAVVAAAKNDSCTVMPTTFSWTSSSPVYKQCDTSKTGVDKLYCRTCDNDNTYKCNTAIPDPSSSVSVHANIIVVVMAMILAVFYRE